MLKKKFFAIVAFCVIFLSSCTDNNPTNFFEANSSSETLLSSSVSVESSSSLDILSSSVEKSSSSWAIYSYGELTDNRDGHVYKTIKIGAQTWMAENLNFAYHNSAAPTPDLASPSLCYNNNPDSCAKYGRLYSWSIAMDSAMVYSRTGNGCGVWKNQKENLCKNDVYNYIRGACPENWHIPSESDIKNIVDYANESEENHTWIKHYWLYGGDDDFSLGQLSQQGYFWSSLEIDSSTAILLNAVGVKIILGDEQKQNARFIRCVKDDVPPVKIEHGLMTDERDGQVYKTIKIGNQTWMAENLNYAYLQSAEVQDSLSWCYNNDPENCTKYGRLYTWVAAMDSQTYSAEFKRYLDAHREAFYHKNAINWHSSLLPDERDFSVPGSCPKNWHIPSVNEWNILLELVNNSVVDIKSAEEMFDDGDEIDVFRFSIFPDEMGIRTCFWTPVQGTMLLIDIEPVAYFELASVFCFSGEKNGASYGAEFIDKNEALSVRCIKDDAAE